MDSRLFQISIIAICSSLYTGSGFNANWMFQTASDVFLLGLLHWGNISPNLLRIKIGYIVF